MHLSLALWVLVAGLIGWLLGVALPDNEE